MPHTYNDIRAAVLDIITAQDNAHCPLDQYEQLSVRVHEFLAARASGLKPVHLDENNVLDPQDKETLLKLFWDLQREGIIELGLDDDCRRFPFFRVTGEGRKLATDR